MVNNHISKVYIVPGLPHILLGHEKSKYWKSLHDSYLEVQKDIRNVEADLILYFSTQWLSVIGYLFQTNPSPEWVHVDPNWYEFGSIPYKFTVDPDFGKVYSEEVKKLGHTVKVINYKGFPIDTGIVVAQKFLNPDNKFPVSMVSCNMYAEKDETIEVGSMALNALKKSGKKAIVVLVSNLSNRYFVKDINPQEDMISSAKDHEWNLKILELLGEGRLEDVSQCTREFSKQANADMGGKGIWWLNGLCGQSNDFKGQVFDYQPVWGTGAAIVSLTPVKNQVEENISKTEIKNESDKVFSSRAPEPVGPYPHARKAGNLLFLSGIGPRIKGSKTIPGVTLDENGKITDYDIETQTRSVIENLKIILEDSGSSFEKIIDVQVFLTDMQKDFKKFNEVYKEYFYQTTPTRTTISVNALPTPIAVELKVIAEI